MIMAKTIAYLRVSTTDQDFNKNKADILYLANEKNLGKVEFIEDTASGKISWHKSKIATILDEFDKGGVI